MHIDWRYRLVLRAVLIRKCCVRAHGAEVYNPFVCIIEIQRYYDSKALEIQNERHQFISSLLFYEFSCKSFEFIQIEYP